jgi:hypothetical protein
VPRVVNCIFCGQRRPGSREHVVPRWVRERLGITSPVEIEVNSALAKK